MIFKNEKQKKILIHEIVSTREKLEKLLEHKEKLMFVALDLFDNQAYIAKLFGISRQAVHMKNKYRKKKPIDN